MIKAASAAFSSSVLSGVYWHRRFSPSELEGFLCRKHKPIVKFFPDPEKNRYRYVLVQLPRSSNRAPAPGGGAPSSTLCGGNPAGEQTPEPSCVVLAELRRQRPHDGKPVHLHQHLLAAKQEPPRGDIQHYMCVEPLVAVADAYARKNAAEHTGRHGPGVGQIVLVAARRAAPAIRKQAAAVPNVPPAAAEQPQHAVPARRPGVHAGPAEDGRKRDTQARNARKGLLSPFNGK